MPMLMSRAPLPRVSCTELHKNGAVAFHLLRIRYGKGEGRVGNPDKHFRSPAAFVTDSSGSQKDLRIFAIPAVSEQSARRPAHVLRKDEDDGSCLLPLAKYLESREGEEPQGVYALYSDKEIVQYVGCSNNMVLSIEGHLQRVGKERCAFVRSMVFGNRAMATPHHLQQEALRWIEEFDQIPPGNAQEVDLWEGPVDTDLQRSSGNETPINELQDDTRHGGNSGVVAETADGAASIAAQASPGAYASDPGKEEQDSRGPNGSTSSQAQQADHSQVVSPFTDAEVHRSMGESLDYGDCPKMTVESVNRALDQVRPYLIADGGNVEVAHVSAGVVFLRLEGACDTCASSATTMRLGIERSLQTTFGEQLREVVQVDQGVSQVITVTTVQSHLNKLQDAIYGAGGKVEVVDIKQGTCVIKFHGSESLGKGIAAAIKDTFPRDIKQVILVGF